MKKELYIHIRDEAEFCRIATEAILSPWKFHFPNHRTPTFEEVKGFYHGNSHLLLHLFFNEIINQYEMQFTTATVERSYHHTAKPIFPENGIFDICRRIFD